MEPSVIALWITAIGGFITGVAGIIVAFRKDKREDKRSDADVAKLYQSIAADQAAKNRELENCQNMLEKKVDALEKQVTQLCEEKDIEVQYSNALVVYIQYLIRLMEKAEIKPYREMPVRKQTQ